jgi:p-aminobenzoyl-glutamate transporter AbgT
MKTKWLILTRAGLVVVAAWATMVVTYVFFHPTLALWTAEATVAAAATEGLMWVCAGVLGFSFLAKRRRMLSNLRRRLFGAPPNKDAASGEPRRP